LYYDLILADHLIQTGYASKIVFHCKTMPWFVSDTLPSDIEWLLEALENPRSLFTESQSDNKQDYKVSAIINHYYDERNILKCFSSNDYFFEFI
jgi:hypothetical protein